MNLIPGILEICLPRACILCGSPMQGSRSSPGLASIPDDFRMAGSVPLCADCIAELEPIGGRRCCTCGAPLISEASSCMRCRERTWSFESAFPLFAYQGGFMELLKAYKFRDRRSLAPFFACLVRDARDSRWPAATIVPVPPRPGKLRSRGWDQIEEIARWLERWGLPVERVLERGISGQQKKLGRAARRDNAGTAYGMRPRNIAPVESLLLDDVFTTGATAEACACALKAGGARSVSVLVLAMD